MASSGLEFDPVAGFLDTIMKKGKSFLNDCCLFKRDFAL